MATNIDCVKQLKKETLIEIARNTEGLEDLEIHKTHLSFLDALDDYREMEITFPECFSFEDKFQFNSAKLDKKRFFQILQKYLHKEFLIGIKKIVFISNKKELYKLIKKYHCQSMDMKKHMGIYWHMDNIILINLKLCKETAKEVADEYFNLQEEYNIAVWGTLIHEIRHAAVSTPVIPVSVISEKEVRESAVEKHCLELVDKIRLSEDYKVFLL